MTLKFFKKLFLVSIFFIVNYKLNAQVFAETLNGDQVILNSDGTWKRIDTARMSVQALSELLLRNISIYENGNLFLKPSNATNLIKSKKIPIGFYVNNKYWGIRRGETNEMSDYYFFNKIDEAYAYMDVNTTIGATLESTRESSLKSAQKIMPDAIMRSCEYRIVNGLRILCTDIIGTSGNYKGEYLMYTYIHSSGAVYITVSNSQEKFLRYRQVYEDFLNGLVSIEK